MAAIALVGQAVAKTTTAQNTLIVTRTTTTGNCLVMCVDMSAATSRSISTITDTAGNTWTAGPIGFVSGTNSRIEIWYAVNATSITSATITIASSLTTIIGANLSEWSGVVTASALDTSNHKGNASTQTPDTGTITTTHADDVLIGAISYISTTNLGGATTAGYQTMTDFPNGGTVGNAMMGVAVYQVVGALQTSVNVAWSLSSAVVVGGAILALKSPNIAFTVSPAATSSTTVAMRSRWLATLTPAAVSTTNAAIRSRWLTAVTPAATSSVTAIVRSRWLTAVSPISVSATSITLRSRWLAALTPAGQSSVTISLGSGSATVFRAITITFDP